MVGPPIRYVPPMERFNNMVKAYQDFHLDVDGSADELLSIFSKQLDHQEDSPRVPPTQYLSIMKMKNSFNSLVGSIVKRAVVRKIYEFCIKQLFCAVAWDTRYSDQETKRHLVTMQKELGYFPSFKDKHEYDTNYYPVPRTLFNKVKIESFLDLNEKIKSTEFCYLDFYMELKEASIPAIQILWNNYTTDLSDSFLFNIRSYGEDYHDEFNFHDPIACAEGTAIVKANMRNLCTELRNFLPLLPGVTTIVFDYLFKQSIAERYDVYYV